VTIKAVQCAEYQRQVKQNFKRNLIFKARQDVKTYGGIEILLRALQIWALCGGGWSGHIPASIISRKTTLLPFHRKLGGHHSRYRRSFEEIKKTACPENRNSIF